MSHAFPIIKTIDDVLPYIEGKEEFKVKDNGAYTTIDYVIRQEDSFDNDVARECRGIKFWPNGEIAARAFHKFFNRGERPDLEEKFEIGTPRFYEKVDGSLVHPVILNGGITWMTMAGVTDIANMARDMIERKYSHEMDTIRDCIVSGWMPLFEYIGPYNRVVVKYAKEDLRFLAMRNIVTGCYAFEHNPFRTIPSRESYNSDDISDVREWKEKEGVVIVYPETGLMLKVKANDYVLKHRIKEEISQEKNVLIRVLNNQVDDLAGIIDKEDFLNICDYSNHVHYNLRIAAQTLMDVMSVTMCFDTRKEVAIYAREHLNSVLASIFFRCYDKNVGMDIDEIYKEIVSHILSNTYRSTKIENMRAGTFKVRWSDFLNYTDEE